MALEGAGFVIVAEVGSAEAAVEAAIRHRPDLCLLDVSMPGGGIAAAERIRVAVPETKIVILTASQDERDLFDALLAGASGYILKDVSADRLPHILRGVLAGESALPRNVERRLVEEFRASEGAQETAGRRFVPHRHGTPVQLTSRELDVLDLLARQLPTGEVAHRLGISEATVRRHVSSAMQKLDVPDRESAVRLVARAGRRRT
jgi:DNA-binding NarL/FixJ family response regulator